MVWSPALPQPPFQRGHLWFVLGVEAPGDRLKAEIHETTSQKEMEPV